MARMNNRKANERRGIALLEMAIVLPLLLIVTCGIIEYGYMFMKLAHANNAARYAVRVGARADGTNAAAVSALTTAMSAGGMTNGTHYSYSISPDPGTVSPGNPITVTITVNYSAVGLGMPLIPVPSTLHATMVMSKEGP